MEHKTYCVKLEDTQYEVIATEMGIDRDSRLLFSITSKDGDQRIVAAFNKWDLVIECVDLEAISRDI